MENKEHSSLTPEDYFKIVDDAFEGNRFCFVEGLGSSTLNASKNYYQIEVTLYPWGSRKSKKKTIESTYEIGNKLIHKYPYCKFIFYYKSKKDIIAESVTISELLEPEPLPLQSRIYKGLPTVVSFYIKLCDSRYNVPLEKLVKLLNRPEEYVLSILHTKNLNNERLSYFDLVGLALDHRIAKGHSLDGKFGDMLLFDMVNGWERAERLTDKTIFGDPYEQVKQKSKNHCFCCGNKGQTIHHIDGDHSNMKGENLVFLCNKCHYELHKDFLEKMEEEKMKLKELVASFK